jgi:hypothetical protein
MIHTKKPFSDPLIHNVLRKVQRAKYITLHNMLLFVSSQRWRRVLHAVDDDIAERRRVRKVASNALS